MHALRGWMKITMNKDKIKAEILEITGASFFGFGITGIMALFTYLLATNVSIVPVFVKENMKLAILFLFSASAISGILWIPLMQFKSWQNSWKKVNNIDE